MINFELQADICLSAFAKQIASELERNSLVQILDDEEQYDLDITLRYLRTNKYNKEDEKRLRQIGLHYEMTVRVFADHFSQFN